MKLTRRARRRVELVLATRKAERGPEPKLNYDNLFDGLITAVHENV